MSKTTLDEFFKIVKTTMEENCFLVDGDNQKELSERIYNCDETAVSTNTAGKKVLYQKESEMHTWRLQVQERHVTLSYFAPQHQESFCHH